MVKILILFIIILGVLIKRTQLLSQGKNYDYILVAGYVLTIPFNITSNLYDFVNYQDANYRKQFLGAFGSAISIETAMVFFFLCFILGYRRFDKKIFKTSNFWIVAFLVICVISIVNPNNPNKWAIVVPFSIFLQFFLLLKLFLSNMSKTDFFRGLFYGLLLSTIVQFVLAIGYPLLGLEFVTTLFKGEEVIDYANRREGYASAIGTFSHPGHLGLFSSLCMIFFFSCYLMKYRRNEALLGLLCASFALFFTYSRTSFVATLIGLSLIYSIFVSGGRLLTFKNVLLFSVILSCGMIILYSTPLGDLFFASDTDEQFDNRFNHFVIGTLIFEKAPLIGVGINSHINYMSNVLNVSSLSYMPILDFYTTNPIHNIHVIVLAEMGIIGLVLWLIFFFGNIFVLSRLMNIKHRGGQLVRLIFSGFLFVFFIYGFSGWAPFSKEVMLLMLCVGSLAFMERVDKKRV